MKNARQQAIIEKFCIEPYERDASREEEIAARIRRLIPYCPDFTEVDAVNHDRMAAHCRKIADLLQKQLLT